MIDWTPPPPALDLTPGASKADALNCRQTAGSRSTGGRGAFKVMNLKPLMSHLAVYGTARSPEAEPYCTAAAAAAP